MYCLSLLFSLKVSLMGRLGGINHISRAFFLSLAMFVLVLPWQKFFSGVVAGVIFTPDELLNRFEAMQEGLDQALRAVGVTEPHPLPHRNPTQSRRDRDYRTIYTPKARQIVSRAYARELREHGYAFDPGSGREPGTG